MDKIYLSDIISSHNLQCSDLRDISENLLASTQTEPENETSFTGAIFRY